MNSKLTFGILFELVNDFIELDHVAFSKNVFWYVNFALSFYQIYYVQISTL